MGNEHLSPELYEGKKNKLMGEVKRGALGIAASIATLFIGLPYVLQKTMNISPKTDDVCSGLILVTGVIAEVVYIALKQLQISALKNNLSV